MCGIFKNDKHKIIENSIVWVNMNKETWQGKFLRIPFSDLESDANNLKVKWMNKKKGFY